MDPPQDRKTTVIINRVLAIILLIQFFAVPIVFGIAGFIATSYVGEALSNAVSGLFGKGDQGQCPDGSIQVLRSDDPDIAAIRKRIVQNRPIYEEAARAHNIPWEMLAALHYREHSNDPSSPSNGEGPYQMTSYSIALLQNPGGITIEYKRGNRKITRTDLNDFRTASDLAANFLQAKVRYRLTANSSDNQVKDAFEAYNGRGYGSPDRSPYVMNNFDSGHTRMIVRGTVDNGRRRVQTIDSRDGAYTVYYLLRYMANFTSSTFQFKDCVQVAAASSGGQSTSHSGEKVCPVAAGSASWGPVTRSNPHVPTYVGHEGLDIFSARGTAIYSATSGEVVKAGLLINKNGLPFGYRVWVDDKQGHFWFYQHMSPNISKYVKTGDTVRAGQQIGEMDNTGAEDGEVHLHLGIAKSPNASTSGLNWDEWYYPLDFVSEISCLTKSLSS